MNNITKPRDGLYLCRRASIGYSDKPCDESFEIEVIEVDERTTDDHRKIPCYKNNPEDWYKNSFNHRVENGRIRRDMVRTAWAVEIVNSLDFVKKYGRCVIEFDDAGYANIKIYDDYIK